MSFNLTTIHPIERTAIGMVLLASLGLMVLVPDNPIKHLDDPSYWGVMGYLLVVILILVIRCLKRPASTEVLILTLFLAGMPIIYVMNWWRFDGESHWIMLEILGMLVYGGMALLSRRILILLSIGIAIHGIWDILHYNQQLYVPNWYVLACAIIDVVTGFYVFVRFRHFT